MTTTIISANTVNATEDGFDLVADGDTLVVAPNAFLGSDLWFGASANNGGYVIDDGVIFGATLGIVLDAGYTSGDYSEVMVASAGAVEAVENTDDDYGIEIPAGSFAIQNRGEVLCIGEYGVAVETGGAGTLINYGAMSSSSIAVSDIDVTSTDRYYLQNYGSIIANPRLAVLRS